MAASFDLKFARAQGYFAGLEAKINAYVADVKTFSTRTAVSADGKQHSIMATLHEEPHEEWGLVIGDTLHNLRCALDHIVWQLASPADRGIHTMFPISTDAGDFRLGRPDKKGKRSPGRSGLRRIAGVDPGAVAVIEAAQPYQPGPAGFGLNVLNQLENLDKHREIHTVAGVFQDIQPGAFPNLGPQETVAVELWRQVLAVDQEAEVFRLTFPSAKASVDMKVYRPSRCSSSSRR
ncbi:MAG: hypothetical protein ACXVRZ_04880 [Gaiellaceae bacterium]